MIERGARREEGHSALKSEKKCLLEKSHSFPQRIKLTSCTHTYLFLHNFSILRALCRRRGINIFKSAIFGIEHRLGLGKSPAICFDEGLITAIILALQLTKL